MFDPRFLEITPELLSAQPPDQHEPTMGNSASPGLGSGSTHGLRDVRTTDPETEVERPPASPEPNSKLKESNRKSHELLPVSSNPYIMNTIVIIETYSEVQERQNKTDKKRNTQKEKREKKPD